MITKGYLLELLNGSESLEEAADKLADEVYTYTFQDYEDLQAMFFAGSELTKKRILGLIEKERQIPHVFGQERDSAFRDVIKIINSL